jgi:5'-nucleotidase
VVLALLGAVPEKPDLVISGINRGANMGTDLIYSGTAAAARQGSLFGVPSVALSLAENTAGNNGAAMEYYWDMAVSFVLAHLDELASQWKADTFINVNIPNSPAGPDGIVAAFPSRREYQDSLSSFKAPNGDTWCFVTLGKVTTKPEPAAAGEGSDWAAVSRNLASVSPILIHPVNNGQGKRACHAGVDHAGAGDAGGEGVGYGEV